MMQDAAVMRTILDLDADILEAAKELAALRGTTAGRVVSDVLVALFDGDHMHHEAAHHWFSQSRRHRWATTAITEMSSGPAQ